MKARLLSPSLNFSDFYHALVEEAPDAIIYSDAGGIIRFWNHGAERIFGFSEQEALENSLDIIVPENLRKSHWDGYAKTMRTGVTRYGAGDVLAVPAVRKDGTRVSIEFSILPFRDREAGCSGSRQSCATSANDLKSSRLCVRKSLPFATRRKPLMILPIIALRER